MAQASYMDKVIDGAKIRANRAYNDPVGTVKGLGLGTLASLPSLVSTIGNVTGYETPMSDNAVNYLKRKAGDSDLAFAMGEVAGVPVTAGTRMIKTINGPKTVIDASVKNPAGRTAETIADQYTMSLDRLPPKAKEYALRTINAPPARDTLLNRGISPWDYKRPSGYASNVERRIDEGIDLITSASENPYIRGTVAGAYGIDAIDPDYNMRQTISRGLGLNKMADMYKRWGEEGSR